MNRRSFLRWLGIGVPAAAVAVVVAPKVEKIVEAHLGEWHNYYSEGDPELMESIENWRSYSEVYPDLKTTFTLNEGSALYYDKEFMKMLKEENPKLFLSLASRNKIQVSAPVKREFFQYNVKP